jgi:Tfp pilus assembly protein PilO
MNIVKFVKKKFKIKNLDLNKINTKKLIIIIFFIIILFIITIVTQAFMEGKT